MDQLLGKLTSHAMNYAIRSGITITASYAIKQSARLLKETPRGSQYRDELLQLQMRLESKIRIISPAIDMIELISARGNTSLESAVSLTKEIRYEIQRLGTRLNDAANEEALLRRSSSKAKSLEATERELRAIINTIKALLAKIEDAVPFINLAITTSGVNLSTKLSGTISPSRLLQASTFLTAADAKYAAQPGKRSQVGPTWTLSLYMLFTGHHAAVDEERLPTWKEVVHKCKVKLVRVPLEELYDLPGQQRSGAANGETHGSIPGDGRAAEFAYHLVIIGDLDDDRVHTFEEGEQQPGPFEDVPNAGIRDIVPIHEVSKVFYADTGKILGIGGDGETNAPVLLLKRDVHAEAPRRMLDRSQMSNVGYFDAQDDQMELDAQIHGESVPNTPLKEQSNGSNAWRLPVDLDPEWMAFEVYVEEPDSESDLEEPVESSRPSSRREDSVGAGLSGALGKLKLQSPSISASNSPRANGQNQLVPTLKTSPIKHPQIKTNLSLLEMLLKLTALQQFRQDSHLSIEDELLNFFLEDSATAGSGGDKSVRRRTRMRAQKTVGFDPYDESPIKRRGEEYIRSARGVASPRPAELELDAFEPGQLEYDGYEDDDEDFPQNPASSPPPAEFIRPSIERPSPRGGGAYQPSSPSPLPTLRSQPPSKSLTPDSTANPPYRSPVAKNGDAGVPQASSSQASLLATPPSTAGSRNDGKQTWLRAQSEPKAKVGSPLARELDADSTGGDDDDRRIKKLHF